MHKWISFFFILFIKSQLQYDHGFIEPSPLFYWLFPNNSTNTLIIWLEGGPGCSFLSDVFMDNGPFRINDQFQPSGYPYGWNLVGNLLYIDQPIGTGFSQSKQYRTSEVQIAKDLLGFFDSFFKKYPMFDGADIYFTGHSYAGHYIAGALPYLLQANPYIFRNVKGVLIGDPLISATAKYQSMPEFVKNHGLLESKFQYFTSKIGGWLCGKLIQYGAYNLARNYCELMSIILVGIKPRFNTGDISNTFINYTNYNHYIPTLMAKLNLPYIGCNPEVKTQLRKDYYTDFDDGLKYLLERMPVVLFYGENDYIDSWESGELLIDGIYPNRDKIIFDWKTYNQTYGYYYRHLNLTMLHVSNAGHTVILYQPEFTFQMIARFILSSKHN